MEAGSWDAIRTPLQMRYALAAKTGIEDVIAMCLTAEQTMHAAVKILRDYQRGQDYQQSQRS
jgi:hypothetical protein